MCASIACIHAVGVGLHLFPFTICTLDHCATGQPVSEALVRKKDAYIKKNSSSNCKETGVWDGISTASTNCACI